MLATLAGATSFASGCADAEPPAMTVGPVEYSRDDLIGLSVTARETLAALTGFGLAVADSRTEELGAPLMLAWTEERLTELLADELVLERAGVGDAELETIYSADPDWELTVRHILFMSERFQPPEHRSAAKAKAERALALLRDGADFGETAARLSEEPGAEGRQGLLQPGREGSWVDEFWNAALSLRPGEIGDVTETEYGYHILRLEAREPVPFEDGGRARVASAVAGRAGDPAAELEEWLTDTGGSALTEAERRGLSLTDPERAAVAARWSNQVERWTETFGFSEGLAHEAVSVAARVALGDPAQASVIARRELVDHSELIQAIYPTVIAN